jgi:hypothetical protein
MFRKQERPAVAMVSTLTLQERVERIKPIIEIMAERAMQQSPRKVRKLTKLATSPELQRQLALLDTMPDEALALFLDMLEGGLPEDFKHHLNPATKERSL